MHPAALPHEDLMAQVTVVRTRASGPGGQHRNKTETAIRLCHEPTGVRGAASERRSQNENLKVAVRRLRIALAIEHRTPLTDADFVAPGAFELSAAWLARVRGGRISLNVDHDDFPPLLAEALDALHLYADDLPRTATALRISASQIVKFLGKEPAALHALNERRRARSQRPLR
ncbi:MAG TPA: peptide chain release factor-like protein [Planctomycetota bacterium]